VFDVFLSHNSQDRSAVEWIACRLRDAGIEPFLDKWHLIPGENWQPAVEKALAASKAVAVFIGPSGISPWNNEEMRTALSIASRSRDEYRVIPVLLPGADENALTGFLSQRTWVDFRNGLDKEEVLQRLVMGIKGIAPASESFTLPDDPAPYRGLFKFEQDHADRFFGREREIEAVLQKFECSSFVAVVGASGVGKSSLLLAGVLPKLEQLRSIARPITTFVVTPGRDPLQALANWAVASLPPADRLDWADKLVQRMLLRGDGLRTAREAWATPDRGTIVLVVDQMEELFTHGTDRSNLAKVEAFASNLRDVIEANSGRIRVLATIRADFFERCLRLEPLRALLQDHDVLLGPMTTDSLRDAIVRPAAAVGAYFEKGVISALLNELDQRPFVLPLLEHALDTLWRQRKGVWLTWAALEAMGGVAGALKKHADECWTQLPEADRAIGRDVLLRLVSLGEGVPDTRRRVRVDELYTTGTRQEQVGHVIDVLSGPEARLLVLDRGADGRAPEVEVAHEILLQEWPTFRAWVDSARRQLRVHRRVTEAAREWTDHGRTPGYLLAGARLLEAEESLGPRWDGLNQMEADLLTASIEAREHEAHRALEVQRARARVLQRSLLAVGGLAGVAMIAAGIAFISRAQAEQERRLARSRELAGTALRNISSDPQIAFLLIQEAYRAAPTELVEEALNRYRSQPGRVTFHGHSDAVASAAFSPNGQQVVTASKDGTARLWDVTTYQELARFRGHVGGLLCAAFGPNGRLLATAGKDGTARLWDTTTYHELAQLRGHEGWVTKVTFRPDGRQVLTASKDGSARLWDADTYQQLARFQGHKGEIWSAAFSPDGQTLITAGDDGFVVIWNATDQRELVRLRGDSGRLWSVAFSPDGRQFVTSGEDGTARIWDVGSHRQLAKLEGHSGWVWSAAFSPDGRRVVTAGQDRTVRIWSTDTHHEVLRLEGHSAFARSASFSPDGLWVITTSDDGTARLWDVANPRILQGPPEVLWSAAFSPDGLRVITIGDDHTALIWDATMYRQLAKLEGHTGVLRNGLFSRDGQRLVTAGSDGTARLWDARNYQELAQFRGHIGGLLSADFSPDGYRLVTAGQDGTIRIWDAVTRRQLAQCQSQAKEIWSATFNPDGRRIVTASPDGARIWDVATCKELAKLEGHSGAVNDATFNPDGRRVVTAGQDGTARIWNTDTHRELAKLRGHSGWVNSASYSYDGLLVVTAGQDGTARVWDATTYKELAQLRGHAGWVLSATFSPDGGQVLTASQDGTARIWPSRMWEPADDRLLALDAGRSLSCEERHDLLHEDCTAAQLVVP